MPTKTDRILSYLPGTFRAVLPVTGQPSALYAIARSVGNELQQAENKLAEVMLSHWVDTADRNAADILDLAKIAALYGLTPQPEEELEEFRRHLKRYVRTFLEGTVTVQGLLRIAAEALGLEIADDYQELDTWWKRSSPELVESAPDADDAAMHVLGFSFATSRGEPARAARVVGAPDLSGGVDLRGADVLYLQVDGAETQTVQLVPAGTDPREVSLNQLIEQINNIFDPIFGVPVASAEAGHLAVTAPSFGAASRLEFEEGTSDAGDRVLGLPPLTFFGQPARAAAITGSEDLSGDLDLSQTRYLRIALDGAAPKEVDCGGATPGHRTVEELRDAVNAALGVEAASVLEEEGEKFLRLVSSSVGHLSSIRFLPAPAQDAAHRLFGEHDLVYLGADEAPAEVFSLEFPNTGVDLSLRFNIRLSVDDSLPITVNCAGLQPAATQLTEIANAINAAFSPAFGGDIARRVGSRLRLISPTAGGFSQLRFETPEEADATELLFGLPPRTRHGSAPTSARLVGKKEIDEVDLLGRHLLSLRVDHAPPVLVDLQQGVANPRKAILQDLVHAVEAQVGDDTATDDGLHLILASPTIGAGSSVEVLPLTMTTRRSYVSRAIITGEASEAVLGFHSIRTNGQPATNARVVGTPDLSRGVDLREGRYLRISVDGKPFKDVDCAGPRPRATLLDKLDEVDGIVDKLNKALSADAEDPDKDVAFSDGKHLILASTSDGRGSSLRFESPQANDALDELLSLPPGAIVGSAASGVTLVGLSDLSAGVDLPAHAALRIGWDDGAPVEVSLTGDDPAHLSLSNLVVVLTLALGPGVASKDDKHLILSSTQVGASAQIELAVPAGVDATPALFGFPAPRAYQGADARAAVLLGKIELSGTTDLSLQRFLRVGVDAKPPVAIDCAGDDPAKTELDEIVKAINATLKADVASAQDDFLKLQSTTSGPSSRLLLERHSGSDARSALLGDPPAEITGDDPLPAEITGSASLTSPRDLSQRSVLRIAVDGGRPRDIDVRGAVPRVTLLEEIVSKINDAFPGLASAVELDQLRLTSPTAGPDSSVDVLPVRCIDLIEYLPQPAKTTKRNLVHGDVWKVDNGSVGGTYARVCLDACSGACGPALVNETIGWQLSLLTTLRPNESVCLWTDPRRGLMANRTDEHGVTHLLPPDQILAGPLGGQAQVPFQSQNAEWLLTGSSQGAARLVLDNPLAPSLLELHAFVSTAAQPEIAVHVDESQPGGLSDAPGDGSVQRLVGRLIEEQEAYRLQGAGGQVIARVRNGMEFGVEDYLQRVVAVQGPYFAAEPPEELPLLIVEAVDCLFDVRIFGNGQTETYSAVHIGTHSSDPGGLAWQVNAGSQRSQLVRADVLDKADVLRLPRGRSRFRYLDCLVDRFNHCVFSGEKFAGGAHFAGGVCRRRVRFDLSRFANEPPELERAVLDTVEPSMESPVDIAIDWESHRPGVLEVRLPADLPPRFGGRFNAARFSRRSNLPELYENAVTEPGPEEEQGENHIVNLINDKASGSQLVVAAVVPGVPLGWSAQQIPFRKPRYLTLGSEETPARIYLWDPEVPNYIELRARSEGDWGNAISVAVRKSGPALFELTVAYKGARFERARLAVAGPELPDLVLDILNPSPVGVRLAKAAGVQVQVTRGGVEDRPI